MKDISIGTVISDEKSDYIIEKRIGVGGFADVYKASCNGRVYAVKVIRDSLPQHVYSLKNEFDIASKVDSNYAVKYYYLNEYGHNDFPCFIIMEYVDGCSLEDELNNRMSGCNPYTADELYDAYTQLIAGMKDINKIAVHRDIKPLNILKTTSGIYKISDYGLAKYQGEATRSASKTMKGYGSYLYYAPECWADSAAHGINDRKVDIYAMGIVFYQLANLRYPYEMIADYRAMHMTSAIKPFNKDVDPVFQSMIRKMMEKSKSKRFDTWEQIDGFLRNSTIGSGIRRRPFVENMLKDTAAKKHSVDEKTATENKKEIDRIEAFRRLVSQIDSEIYSPLKQIADEYNNDSTDRKVRLTDIVIKDDEEECSFEYSIDPIGKDEDERTIIFSFQSKHTDVRKPTRVMPILASGYYDDMPGVIDQMTNHNRRDIVTEYKYLKNRILLWGIIKADCGAGINIAIIEDSDDPLYGKMKTFIRTPNVIGNESWLPIESEYMLKKLCNMEFREMLYTIKVEDFNFNIVEMLLRQNEIFKYGTIQDPIEHSVRFPIV